MQNFKWLHAKADARFTLILLKALSDQVYDCFNCGFYTKRTRAFLLQEIIKEWSELNTLNISRKTPIFPHNWSNKGSKGIISLKTQSMTQIWRQLVSREWQLQDLRLDLCTELGPMKIKPTVLGWFQWKTRLNIKFGSHQKTGMRQFQQWKSAKYIIKPVLWTQLCGKRYAT